MHYEIKSKPTIYNGTKYRSRLEARWAAMFDLLGWRHQYEPYDLSGWTPDFIVYGSDNRYILFEIKPFIDNDILNDYRKRIYKLITKDFQPKCIILDNQFAEDPAWGPMLAGRQICDVHKEYSKDYKSVVSWEVCGECFQVHWKDQQSGFNSQYDIGSAYMSFDGLLWHDSDHSRRKQFIDANYNGDEIRTLWMEAGERSRFHYNE